MIKCNYCGSERKNLNSKSQHELYCKSNPDKRNKIPSYGMLGKRGSNQFTKAKKLGLPKPDVKESTRQILAEKTSEWNKKIWQDIEFKKRHQDAMKSAVDQHPDSYNSGNRGRVKQIEYDGIKFHGSWEVEFYKWCKFQNIDVLRNRQGFKYVWEGERTYFPDFFIPAYNFYVEIKGYETERDYAKWSVLPKQLKVLTKTDIMDIKQDKFSVENFLAKEFWECRLIG
jgi:hypothetical protein